ncbi:uncharacterized protein EI97DRAFT_101712 [Westerdykella ornata]|uniref:Uncharacterized protein n=1 Tax=Westerdykella ornata TaxID=318751 RepID=A0A6A6JE24_WESOR|nr:uncharacterized protein EI97DRAFT_101712 [Westerdykella ornata]KAF2274537.1 hypothetical protein EI97DRAFT_101712 [Westerdykella ornata]
MISSDTAAVSIPNLRLLRPESRCPRRGTVSGQRLRNNTSLQRRLFSGLLGRLVNKAACNQCEGSKFLCMVQEWEPWMSQAICSVPTSLVQFLGRAGCSPLVNRRSQLKREPPLTITQERASAHFSSGASSNHLGPGCHGLLQAASNDSPATFATSDFFLLRILLVVIMAHIMWRFPCSQNSPREK